MKSLLFFVLMAASIPNLWAADWKPVKGTYAVTAKNYLDPPEEEAKDSHIRFQLSGETARGDKWGQTRLFCYTGLLIPHEFTQWHAYPVM